MPEPVRWGILSTARINDKLLAGARLSERVDVVAVASRDQARADAYAREHGIARGYGSYEELLADPEIEAVYISLPNGMHIDWSIRALAAGKHVLCEKPLSPSAAAVAGAFDAADAHGRLLMEAFMWRHNPQTLRLRALIEEGAIGRLLMVRATFAFHLENESDPRMIGGEMEGGALLDVGCYCLSAIRLLCGEPARVSGEQIVGGRDVDVAFAGVLGFDGDVVAHFDCGFAYTKSEELVVLGERGSLHLADPWHARRPGIELRSLSGESESIALEPANSYQLQLENFSAAIRGAGAPLLGREDALGQARAIEALYASANTHSVVAL